MFFGNTYATPMRNDDEYKHMRNGKGQRGLIHKIREKARGYLVLFLETSSIHGLNHLVAQRRHPLEKFLWLQVVTLSVFGSIYLSRTTWTRYQYSPTVVSMDRDMFAWNTTFPCVTICPHKKVDMKKLEAYVTASPEPDKDRLTQFILALAKATYENFETVPDYDVIPSENYRELLLNLSAHFSPTLTIGASGISLTIVPTLTEMGLCYAINSKVAYYNSPEYVLANRWDILKTYNETFFVHPLDGEVFAQVMNLSTSYDVFIHGPLELPDISTKQQYSDEGFYMKLYVVALTVYTAPEAAKLVSNYNIKFSNHLRTLLAVLQMRQLLSVAQRRCRFPHENPLQHSAVYTYNACRMECRIRLCFKYCQCIPHFYRRVGDEPVCDVQGMRCLSKYKEELYQLSVQNGKKINCGCYPICDDVNYVIQSNVLQEWFLGTNLQWGIVTYPRMRYRRDIIFGFTDVLVSVGGMAGLFLGCSVLSFMEIVYFLSLRLICYTQANIKK